MPKVASLLHQFFIFSQNFCHRKSPKKYFFIFRFEGDVWPGVWAYLIHKHTACGTYICKKTTNLRSFFKATGYSHSLAGSLLIVRDVHSKRLGPERIELSFSHSCWLHSPAWVLLIIWPHMFSKAFCAEHESGFKNFLSYQVFEKNSAFGHFCKILELNTDVVEPSLFKMSPKPNWLHAPLM